MKKPVHLVRPPYHLGRPAIAATLVVVLLIGVAGYRLLRTSHAAASVGSAVEAESASLSGPQIVSDSTASGLNSIKFGTTATSNPLGSIGAKSGLSWNSGMWGTGNPADWRATINGIEAGRGRGMDVWAPVGVNNWDSISNLSTLAQSPQDRTAVIDVVAFPSGSNWNDMAAGLYNSFYQQMGASAATKNGGFPVVIRLAWEFNGGAVNGVAPATFIAAWHNAYASAKAGAGAHPERVVFDWSPAGLDPANGQSVFNYYPGDANTDIIGVDNYDFPATHETTQANFDSASGNIYNTYYSFAQTHHKMLALDEWGGAAVNGDPLQNDNASYVSFMFAWIRAHKAGLAYEMYFQTDDPLNVNNALFNPTRMPSERDRYILELSRG